MEDGCPNAGDNPTPPSTFPGELPSYKAAVRCCDYDGETCITPQPCLLATYKKAHEKCADEGRRLCTTDELKANKCCGTGCGFDSKLTWANFKPGLFFI